MNIDVIQAQILSLIECKHELEDNYSKVKKICYDALHQKGIDTNAIEEQLQYIDQEHLQDYEVVDHHRPQANEEPLHLESYEVDLSGASSSSGMSDYEEYMMQSSELLKDHMGSFETKYIDEIQLVELYKKAYQHWSKYDGEGENELKVFILGVNENVIDSKMKACLNTWHD